MKVLITGSSGLLGSGLAANLREAGHTPLFLVRCQPDYSRGEMNWNPEECRIDSGLMKNLDAVVHLAGENLVSGRWTPEKKKKIRESRIEGTRLLCESLAMQENPPKVLVSASAIGIYGDRGSEILTEESGPGKDFVAELCRDWEAATAPAAARGIRTVVLRIGIVLSLGGGALAKIYPQFSRGLGGNIGGGAQYMSWIDIDDAVRAILFCMENESISGPVNVTAPAPVRNHEFTETLARLLKKPALLHVPAFAVRLAFGELADTILLASANVIPAKLAASGFSFKYETLEKSLARRLENG